MTRRFHLTIKLLTSRTISVTGGLRNVDCADRLSVHARGGGSTAQAAAPSAMGKTAGMSRQALASWLVLAPKVDPSPAHTKQGKTSFVHLRKVLL